MIIDDVEYHPPLSGIGVLSQLLEVGFLISRVEEVFLTAHRAACSTRMPDLLKKKSYVESPSVES